MSGGNLVRVDPAARRALATALSGLAAGRLTNDQFEDRIPSSSDRAVSELARSAWMLYDDMFEHRLVGNRRLPREGRREVAKWILFLRSDHPYTWPPGPGLTVALLNVVTMGALSRILGRRWTRGSEEAFWPFPSEAAFERARVPVPVTGTAGESDGPITTQ